MVTPALPAMVTMTARPDCEYLQSAIYVLPDCDFACDRSAQAVLIPTSAVPASISRQPAMVDSVVGSTDEYLKAAVPVLAGPDIAESVPAKGMFSPSAGIPSAARRRLPAVAHSIAIVSDEYFQASTWILTDGHITTELTAQ
ncbi:hypothetical protein [Streptomyces solaniscabiei]|uniref:hypothetical protein n=1 Tax=Streptomyces solaniscabiei TaxID=2683255 RepID=UPI001CE23EA7|nr:hypothetical protein [Streptomyces solaniscabiei]